METTFATNSQPPLASYDNAITHLWETKTRGDVVSHEDIEQAAATLSPIKKNSRRWGGLINRMKKIVLINSGHEVISVRGTGYCKAEASQQGAERPKAKLGRLHRSMKKTAITAALVPNHELTDQERSSRDITTACLDQQMGAVTRARQEQKMLRLSNTK